MHEQFDVGAPELLRLNKMATALRLLFLFWMMCPFLHFMTAGANTFIVPKLRDNGALLGQISFISGLGCVLGMGLF